MKGSGFGDRLLGGERGGAGFVYMFISACERFM